MITKHTTVQNVYPKTQDTVIPTVNAKTSAQESYRKHHNSEKKFTFEVLIFGDLATKGLIRKKINS
jgi:hypothetical protein